MIILRIYDLLYGTRCQNNGLIILICEILRNVYALVCNLLTTVVIFDYYVNCNIKHILPITNVLLLNLVIDSFFIQDNLIYLHHFIGIGAIQIYKSYEFSIVDFHEPAITIIAMEISSVFLCIRYLMEYLHYHNRFIENINNALFVMSFVMTRIFNFYHYFFYTNTFYDLLHSYEIYDTRVIDAFLYSLFALNMYWAWLIMCAILKT